MMKILFKFALALAVILVFSAEALAHRLNVFAWLENDNVIVQCGFGANRPARQAVVRVLDAANNKELLQGETDNAGRYEFKAPEIVRSGHGLLIDVSAGQGHRGEWRMAASELYAAASLTAGFDQAALESARENIAENNKTVAPEPPAPDMALPVAPPSLESIRQVVNEAVETRLAPMRQHLAELSARGPALNEIIGGIGWIMGLVGIFLYFQAKRGKRQEK